MCYLAVVLMAPDEPTLLEHLQGAMDGNARMRES
jgi:hypothetical protein